MKRFASMALASLFLVLVLGGEACSQDPKEVKFTGTHYYGYTPQVVPIDENEVVIQFEILGVRINDEGGGPFHEASVHIAGILYKGMGGKKLRGFETWMDKDGDKLIWELAEKQVADAQPGTSPGTATVVSGTGKYAGAQGTMDWLLRYPKPFPAGTGRGICTETVTLTLAQ